MAEPRGAMGTKVFISSTTIADTVDTEREFSALTWNEIGYVSNVSQHGIAFQDVPFTVVGGRTYHLKGAYDYGPVELQMALDLSDAGQLLLKTAAESVSQDHYGFRIEKTDAPSSYGGPTQVYFRGLAQSFVSQMGDANTVLMANSRVAINGEEIDVDPAELSSRFHDGDSLGGYNLFVGSDAQAVQPTISSNRLLIVSGDANTSFAVDGSQLIGATGYTLSAGALIFEVSMQYPGSGNIQYFVGFTDQTSALEMPIESAASGNTITTTATDAVGFMFDTSMATDNRWLVGVNNNVDETAQDSGTTSLINTEFVLRIEIDVSGNASFYVAGAQVGTTMTTACRTSVSLYPTIAVGTRGTATRTLSVSRLYVRQG
jgi:hypothetical protein